MWNSPPWVWVAHSTYNLWMMLEHIKIDKLTNFMLNFMSEKVIHRLRRLPNKATTWLSTLSHHLSTPWTFLFKNKSVLKRRRVKRDSEWEREMERVGEMTAVQTMGCCQHLCHGRVGLASYRRRPLPWKVIFCPIRKANKMPRYLLYYMMWTMIWAFAVFSYGGKMNSLLHVLSHEVELPKQTNKP